MSTIDLGTKQFKVEIREKTTNDVIKSSVPTSMHKASKLEDAYDINLDHDKYYTAVVEENK